ncbi:MAG: alpha/beta hydrolase [Thermanaerothrix sp.]|jgi:carboxylesterase|uniref:Alpha/beta fold hydrolase n=1 Tax=Thermanaerothrix solaris TaxID=3058434 RepID=A0ABU3NKD8_9CHLR|nr:alpha/beta fold hydrolase [Thermanaerothrix sp. 4228-RoL]MDT8897316.1 alpha/beta fold hydrolase [Thermanaerothrix sp. 4228-RoL]
MVLMSEAQPFFFPRGRTACLLIHGFTGTPKEMRKLGEYLADLNYTVLGIRLAGHATRLEDLMRCRWEDWLASVEDGLALLHANYDQVFAIGLSMGGVLALLAAANYPLHGAVGLSTPYDLPHDWRLRFIRWLKHLLPTVPKGTPDWHNPALAKDHREYPAYPTAGIEQLMGLLAKMRQELPLIRIPVLLIHSRQDRAVSPENAIRIYEHLETPEKKLIWLENSGHVITCDTDHPIVFHEIATFLKTFSVVETSS